MKNRMVAVLVCFVLMFSVVSCDDQEKNVGYGSMSVEVSNGDNSKTIRPTDESLAFVSYKIKGRYGTNEEWTVNESFSSKTIEVDHLEVGDWEFLVEGFNTDGVLLAKSEPHVVAIKTNGLAKETYTLDWIDGFGSLKLSVKVQSSRVLSIECQLYDESGNVVGEPYTIGKKSSVLGDDNFYLFEKVFEDVPTGFYKAEIVMKDKDGEPIGKTLHQSVHVHDGLESSFDFTWKGFPNLLPQVDVPKPCFDDGATIPCDSKILLGTEEESTSIFYSFDGKSYSSYTENGIDLSQMQDLSNSIKIWVYAEKTNLNKSEIGTYTLNIEHNCPDRKNAEYTWNAIEGWYECIATSKCKYHTSIKCETEKADVSYEVLIDSTEHEEGKCRYTAKFGKDGYEKQTNDGFVPTKHRLVHHGAKSPTCTEIGWSVYDTCSDCGYTTCKEIAALGHDLVHHDARKPNCTIGWESYDECTRGDYTTYKEIPAQHVFVDFKCERCRTWMKGPAGGYVFYDCDADNDSSVNDGRGEDNLMSSECGWRYLEAAPVDLRVVNGVPTIDSTMKGYSSGTYEFIFGYYRIASDGSNLFVNGKTSKDDDCTRRGVGEGGRNTRLHVDAIGGSAYTDSSGSHTTDNYAARLCDILEYEVNGEIFDDWFLPSNEELNLMYKNLWGKDVGSFGPAIGRGYAYWSSTEVGSFAIHAWRRYFASGAWCNVDRSDSFRVRPVRAF